MKKQIVFIPFTQTNLKNQKMLVKHVFRYLPCKKIKFVGNKSLRKAIIEKDIVIFVDEDELYDGLTYTAVQNELVKICGKGNRAGWYFQQFLKMAFALITTEESYIVWDADSIPLNPISYENTDGRFLFTVKTEHHQPYFDTIASLLPRVKLQEAGTSFIAEQMIIKTDIMRRLIDDIGGGKDFWRIILNACDPETINLSGFSEFETYGNYVMSNKDYALQYMCRTLRCCRRGGSYVGAHPGEALLAWAAESLDMISIEISDDPHGLPGLFFYLAKNTLFRRCVSLQSCMFMRKHLSRVWRFVRRDRQYYIEFD